MFPLLPLLRLAPHGITVVQAITHTDTLSVFSIDHPRDTRVPLPCLSIPGKTDIRRFVLGLNQNPILWRSRHPSLVPLAATGIFYLAA
ncbi:hypothetical protein Cob_v003467 [Colletotrichum orbiculare MAFF 240422]|uniref:Uncharacterized protein n=1 Tax=Colletotrichum orbiculare (strain 104-T / ATCC 96160 / CBS 514.97 / LARS 414 / MAFF 240422) TaxID=1213857 RepID=A0A484G2H8_COLOR|nr:hypothetical protein Cob_v003467 [Colletotrichum orbiculare MAFF 240422]